MMKTKHKILTLLIFLSCTALYSCEDPSTELQPNLPQDEAATATVGADGNDVVEE